MHERASRQNRKIAFQHVWRGGEYRKTALAIALLLAAAFVARADTVLAFSPSGTGTHATESIPTDVSSPATGAFTWEAWFKASDLTLAENRMVAQTGWAWNDAGRLMLAVRKNGKNPSGNQPALEAFYYNGSNKRLIGSTVVTEGWHHAALVRSGTTISLYLDGAFETNTTDYVNATPSGASTAPLLIGPAFYGSLAEVRLWNVARTAAEIASTKNKRLTGNETNLLGYWPLDEGTATVTPTNIVTGVAATPVSMSGNTVGYNQGAGTAAYAADADLALTPVPAAGTVYTTTAAGGKWSEIAWTPSTPVSGTGARIVLAGEGAFENDLGTFSLNALTFSATASLSGDGLVFAAEGGANPTLATIGAATNDVNVAMRLDAPLAWTGDNAAGSLRLNGALSGTGDLIHDPTTTNIVDYINGDNSAWRGNLDHRLAYLVVSNSVNLGTGGFYCTNTTFRVNGLTSLRIYGSNTITNRLYLGPETTAQGRLMLQGGNFVVTSPISVNTSKIYGRSATVAIRGPISGSKVVFDIDSASTFSVETPLSLTTGAKQLCLGNTGGKVVLNTPGCDFGYYLGFNRPTLVCGGEYYYPAGANFASLSNSNADARLDLNGYSQILGAFTAQGALVRPFTILNSKAGTCPTVTIRQTADNATTNLHFSGSMNLVKEGSSLLGIGEPVNGDITVREGVLKVAASISGDIARKVIVDGGVLDLGGQRVTCRVVEIKGGGSVRNGTLAADRVVADEPSYMNSVSFASDVPHASYAHPSGTVIHFPFDGSLATALRDATTNEYDLSVKSGRPVYSAEGRSGGCLYFDGSTVLEVTPFPELVPTGSAPYTVSFWAKAAEGCNNHGGWIGYGKPSVAGGANNFRLNGNYTTIWNYWYARDVGATLPSGNFRDEWHHVVGTYDGTTRRLYCDGVLKTTNSSHTPNFGNEQFLIGKTLNDVNFTGWIDDLLIANRAFTDAEVATLYQDGGVTSTQSGSGSILDVSGGDLHFNSSAIYYPFNSAATLFSDHSGNGANLHVAGGSGGTFSADSPFATGGSLYLDGSTWLEASAFPPSMPTGNMARTVACFIKPAADVVKEGAMLSWGTNKSTQYMNFALRSWGDRLGLFPWGSDNVYVSCTRSDILDHWNSLVAVWNGSQVSLYTNGVCAVGPASYQNTSILATPAGGFTVGKAYYAASYYKGNMAELAVWDRVLTAAEIAAYHQSGAASISPELEVVHLAGTGSVKASSLMVTDSINASLALSGDLTLADGVTVAARDTPTAISGTLTIAGGGTVALPAFDASFATWSLFTASSISGAANLAGWSIANLPRGKKATVQIREHAVVVAVTDAGMMLIFK